MTYQSELIDFDLKSIFANIEISEEITQSALQSDVVLLPVGRKDAPMAFARGAADLYQYFKSHSVRAEIACDDDKYEEIELNSRVLRLGKILLKDVALPITLGVLSSYIFEATKNDDVEEPIVEFVSPTKLDVEIVVIDSLSTSKSLSIKFEGDANDFPELAKEIETIWNER